MIKNNKIIFVLFALIILLASVLRIWQLGVVPLSLDWDEVALGYNAYSIMLTGKDEYGKFMPPIIQSFGDYKPALYVYLSIPSILFFGLSSFAVRFPSAVFGIIATISVFYLVKEIFEKYKYRDYISLLSAFFFAISPWSIQFSRVGFESNIGLTLNILTVLFFLRGLKTPWMLTVSAFFAGVCIYAYQSEKIFTPLLVLALVLIYRKTLFNISKKYLYVAFALGTLVILPITIYMATNTDSFLRAKGTSIFSYQTEILESHIPKIERDIERGDMLGKFIDNRRIVYFKKIIEGYISHFDLNWLFLKGDIPRHHAPNMGLLYLMEFPFIILGIYKLIFSELEKKKKYVVLSWFLIAAVPASVTLDVPHAVRALNFLPLYQIFSALGFLFFFLYLGKWKKIKYFILIIISVVFLTNVIYYLNQYFIQQNYYYSSEWQYGYKETVEEVKKISENYSQIIVSDSRPMDNSYMFFLFYLKYSPSLYQDESGIATVQGENKRFDKYEFRPLNWEKDSKMQNTLLIGSPTEIPQDANIIKTIRNMNDTVAIVIAGT